MYLKEQRYVCAIAETKSLGAAADKLHLSKSALSLYINNLEWQLGVKLFIRTNKQFIPTQAGNLYIDTAKEMLALEEQFTSSLEDIRRAMKGRFLLRVVVQPFRAPYLSSKLILAFREHHPNVDLSILETNYQNATALMQEGKFDAYIGICYKRINDFHYFPVLHDQLLLICAADHPCCSYAIESTDQTPPFLDLRYLKDETFILYPEWHILWRYIDNVFKENQMWPKAVYRLIRTENIMQMIHDGLGVGFVPESYLSYRNFQPPLERYRVCKCPQEVDFSVVSLRTREVNPYIDFLVETVRQFS